MRLLLGIQQAVGNGELGKVHWVPGPQNLADGPTEEKRSVALFLLLLQSGLFFALAHFARCERWRSK